MEDKATGKAEVYLRPSLLGGLPTIPPSSLGGYWGTPHTSAESVPNLQISKDRHKPTLLERWQIQSKGRNES